MQEAQDENKTGNKSIGIASLVFVILLAVAAYLYYENAILKDAQGFLQEQAHEALTEKDTLFYQLAIEKEQSVATSTEKMAGEHVALDESLSLKRSDVLSVEN